jgi:hypothetical protein
MNELKKNINLRILHSAILTYPSIGIVNQMEWEAEAAFSLNINWYTLLYCPRDLNIEGHAFIKKSRTNLFNIRSKWRYLFNWFKFKFEYYVELKKNEKKIDLFILRYSILDPFQFLFLIFVKKPVFFLHHTLEIEELKIGRSNIFNLKVLCESIFFSFNTLLSNGIVAVTNEILRYEKRRLLFLNNIKFYFLYPNGIKFDYNNQVFKYNQRKSVINIMFIAGYFHAWHGLDLVVSNCKLSDLEFKLHIVGDIDKVNKNLILNDPRFVYHGKLNKDEIKLLSLSCDVGLSSFALFRKSMTEACTLKTREYLSLGLPVYSGHPDVFPDNFQFYKIGFPKIKDILDYGNEMRKFSKLDIIEKSKIFIDKKILLSNFYSDLVEKYRY